MTRTTLFWLAVFSVMLPAASDAVCYTVYDKSDVPIYRSFDPPFDLSIPISQGIAKKYPGGYLLKSESSYCPPIEKKGDTGFTSVNSEIHQRVVSAKPGQVETVHVIAQSDDQVDSSNAERIRAETTNKSRQGPARDPRCDELLDELKNLRVDNLSIGELLEQKIKRNKIREEFEMRCQTSSERQVSQESRSNEQVQNQLRQMKNAQRSMTMCPDGSYVAGTGCQITPKGGYIGTTQ